jgi:5-methyltetrahydropteroyltriglutamate--homocysteine methyltransferase
MYRATSATPLPTTITGSLPRPGWLTTALRGRPLPLALADADFREQYVDGLAALLADQTRAGLDILTDGDLRCDPDVAGRSWFSYVAERLPGLAGYDLGAKPMASNRGKEPGDIMFEVLETRVLPRVVGRLSRGSLEYARAFKMAQRMTPAPVKFGAISAQTFERGLSDEVYRDRRELVMDLSAIFNAEFHELADAGCPVIQIEAPAIHAITGIAEDWDVLSPSFYVDAFNREVAGLRAKTEVWCHTCWGNPAAQRTEHRRYSYAPSLPFLDRLDVDVLTFEAADNDGVDLEAIGKSIGPDKKIAIGVVSHRTLQVERPEEVADLVRRALRHIAPERLVLSTDCGFGRQGMSRLHAVYKMAAIVRGANLVRKELGLPVREAPIVDARFSLLG